MHSPLASVRQLRDFGFGGPPVSAGGRTKPDLTSWDWYWKLDEATGLTAVSTGSKTGLNGTLTNHVGGLPTWETDAELGGSCLRFGVTNGVRNAVNSASFPANWRPTTTFSVLCCVKSNDLGGAGKYRPLVTQGDYILSSNRNGWYLYFAVETVGITASTTNGSSTYVNHNVSHAAAGIVAGEPYLIGWVKNGTSSKLYVNGVQVGTTGTAVNTIGYDGTERNCIGFISDPTFWTDPNATYNGYVLDGWVGFAAGVASDQSANMLSIAQAAGFA